MFDGYVQILIMIKKRNYKLKKCAFDFKAGWKLQSRLEGSSDEDVYYQD